MAKWVVDIKGTYDEDSFEISVLRDDNTHGKCSYGWFDENKLLISSSGGPCRDGVIKPVWQQLHSVAQKVASDLNKKEENG